MYIFKENQRTIQKIYVDEGLQTEVNVGRVIS